jgi:DNA-binding transcriptional regulator YdaS (Cro superfamily)
MKKNKFVDGLIEKFKVKNDAALCRMLGIAPPQISKIRHGITGVSALMILTIHEKTDMPVKEIKSLLSDAFLDELVQLA